MNVPMPWERLLWSGRPLRLTARAAGERYVLTDFRLVHLSAIRADEIALDTGKISSTKTKGVRCTNVSWGQ